MSSTDHAHHAISIVLRMQYRMSSTDHPYHATYIVLRMQYRMSSTDHTYLATSIVLRMQSRIAHTYHATSIVLRTQYRMSSTDHAYMLRLSPYAQSTPFLVLITRPPSDILHTWYEPRVSCYQVPLALWYQRSLSRSSRRRDPASQYNPRYEQLLYRLGSRVEGRGSRALDSGSGSGSGVQGPESWIEGLGSRV
eukprot:3940970-Rhodomonas_salina.2